jgi:hypothetical protein
MYDESEAILIYVFADNRIANLDIIKKHLTKVSLLIVVCDT